MKETLELHGRQSLWLDNSTRRLLSGGTVKYCIDELSGTYHATAIRIGLQEE